MSDAVTKLSTKTTDSMPCSANPNGGTQYRLAGVDYPSSEARQAGAKAHPQWAAYLKWDRTVHCGYPDMDDAGDRMEFEAFVTGAAGSGRDSQNGGFSDAR